MLGFFWKIGGKPDLICVCEAQGQRLQQHTKLIKLDLTPYT